MDRSDEDESGDETSGLVPDVRAKKLRIFAYENAAGVLVVLDVAYTRHENVAYKMRRYRFSVPFDLAPYPTNPTNPTNPMNPTNSTNSTNSMNFASRLRRWSVSRRTDRIVAP
jgi:hypothetical protein